VDLALRASKLFTLDPSHVHAKMPVLQAIRRALDQPDDAWSTLHAHPLALTYAVERLRHRLALAKSLSGRFGYIALLCLSERKAQILEASTTP
jgi:hypothetical protein